MLDDVDLADSSLKRGPFSVLSFERKKLFGGTSQRTRRSSQDDEEEKTNTLVPSAPVHVSQTASICLDRRTPPLLREPKSSYNPAKASSLI